MKLGARRKLPNPNYADRVTVSARQGRAEPAALRPVVSRLVASQPVAGQEAERPALARLQRAQERPELRLPSAAVADCRRAY